MQAITLEPSFILQARPYRETSLLLDCLTQSYGRIACVARGVRASKQRGIYRAFVPLLLSLRGRRELLTLDAAEAQAGLLLIPAKRLIHAWYLNELLQRLLRPGEGYPGIFYAYEQCLRALTHPEATAFVLCLFEKRLLSELGYALPLTTTCHHQAIRADGYYRYQAGEGFIEVPTMQHACVFSGACLLALHTEDDHDPQLVRAMRLLLRLALQDLLGEKPLQVYHLLSPTRLLPTSQV